MTYQYIIIISLLFAISIVSVSRGEDSPAHVAPHSPATPHQQQIKTKQPEIQSTVSSVSHVDFTDLNLSTPESAALSFVQRFNSILPITTTVDLQEICTKLTISSYQKSCFELFEIRLNNIKNIALNLESAMFKYKPPTQLSTHPMQLKEEWIEKLSFFDGSIKINDNYMIITLKKSDNDWKIYKIKYEN